MADNPVGVPGHLQLVSKRHICGITDMNTEEVGELSKVLYKCETALLQGSLSDPRYDAVLRSSSTQAFVVGKT
eukprot:scaffold931_cov383-Prasinococcus_capsulatus_cf.AAC.8